MASRVTVECPSCEAKLNLPDASKVGKKIKCPKCSEVFVAESMDDDVEDEAPARGGQGRKRASAGGKKGPVKKGKSSGGGSKAPLIIGGVVAVLALVGIGLFLGGFFSSPPAPAPAPVAAEPMPAPVAPPAPPPGPPPITEAERALALRWLPADTEMVVHLKIADLWQAPLLKWMTNRPLPGPVMQFQKETGLTPADIESATIGVVDLQGAQGAAMAQTMGLPPQVPKLLVVVRVKKALSPDEFLKSSGDMKQVEYNSKTYFEAKAQDGTGCWLAEPSTVIFGSVPELKAAMDRGETVIPRQELKFMDHTPHLVVMVAPREAKAIPLPEVPGASAAASATQKAIMESMSAFGLAGNVKGGFDLQAAIVLRDAGNAGTVQTGFNEMIGEARKNFEGFKSTAPPVLADLGELLLNNLKVDLQSQTVRVSTSVPDSAQEKLEQAGPVLALMAMTGGLSGGGAGPDIGAKSPGLPATGTPSPPTSPVSLGPNPGESQPVPADSAEGLIDELSLSVITAWNRYPSSNSEGKPNTPMELMLDIKGPGLSEICGAGAVQFKSMPALKTSGLETLGRPSATKAILPYDASQPSPFDPEGTLRLSIMLDAPPETSMKLDSLEGTLRLLSSEESEEFTIDEAPKLAKRPLTDPGLKAAGVKLLLSKSTFGEALTISCGKGFYMGKATAVDIADGEENPLTLAFTPDIEKSQPVQRLASSGKFAEKLQIRLKLHRKVNEQVVTFKFSNVPLPPPDQRPKPQ